MESIFGTQSESHDQKLLECAGDENEIQVQALDVRRDVSETEK